MPDKDVLWQHEARRLGGDNLVEKIDQMADDLHDIKTQLQSYGKAFPSGDIDGHARYHAGIIERNAELRRLRVAIQEKTISGLVWVGILWAGQRLFALLAPRLGL